MDEDELRQFYMAAGAALAIGGFVVLATNAMTLAVTNLPHGVPWLAYADFSVAAVGLSGGTIIIARALMGKSLVGSKRARRVGNDRLFAQGCLGTFLDTGYHIASMKPENRVLGALWGIGASHMVRYFYGTARASSLRTDMTETEDPQPVRDVMQPMIIRLASLIDQAHNLKLLRSFDRSVVRELDWYKFLLENAPYRFEEILPPEV
jgi:hypothetical protein